jgi:hypothetical protein
VTEIKQLNAAQARRVFDEAKFDKLYDKALDFCLLMSTTIWGGFVDGKVICIWGVIPPTLMSHQAYMWLHVTDALKEHQFILIRHSQMVIEDVLKEHPSIVGHCAMGATKSIRWLKWLGAKFGHPQGDAVPFRINRQDWDLGDKHG